ncbi:MAG: rRNA maturation RNase YbeY [Oxalobacter sp.]|nr:MAG: rRNA maturation RNase YbeY [Oxalobacter sp.]
MATENKFYLSVQYPDPRLKETLTRSRIRRWVQAALLEPAQLTIRFVNAKEGRALNRDYRGKDYATNVLAFDYDNELIMADIILCTDILKKEAREQGKTLIAHAAHLIVHGVLHAQRYDHERSNKAAREMEALEIAILAKLGFPDPYQ